MEETPFVSASSLRGNTANGRGALPSFFSIPREPMSRPTTVETFQFPSRREVIPAVYDRCFCLLGTGHGSLSSPIWRLSRRSWESARCSWLCFLCFDCSSCNFYRLDVLRRKIEMVHVD